MAAAERIDIDEREDWALPPPIEPEIFRGYLVEDLIRLNALGAGARPSYPDGLVDWFGVKINLAYAPWLANRAGQVIEVPPLPTDTFLSEGIEYAALALALDNLMGDKFTSVELGAGWGPWTALAAVCARRRGVKNIRIGAFEADPKRFRQMREHLYLNNLVPLDAPSSGRHADISYSLEQSAIWWEDCTLYWPVAPTDDSGRSVSTTLAEGPDYRGHVLKTVPIPARSLFDVLRKFGHVDFLHVDIQGAELDIIPRCAEAIESTTRLIFIGTHSRKIEGELFDTLYGRGWKLLREQPCGFDPLKGSPSLAGLTIRDGGQVWAPRNRKR